MNTWTAAARDELEKYLAAIRRPLEQAGADAAEVMEDLKRHLEEEISLARLRVVTVTDLRPMLARIGQPWTQLEPARRTVKSNNRTAIAVSGSETAIRVEDPKRSPPGKPTVALPSAPGWWLLFCAVIYPTLTLGIEWVTGFCASQFFNPIPTWGHVFLVALVPAV